MLYYHHYEMLTLSIGIYTTHNVAEILFHILS